MTTKGTADALASAQAEYDARVATLRDAFLTSPRQSDAARILRCSGKVLRDNSRRHGKYVSRGDVWTAFAPAMWDTPYVQARVVALLGARPTGDDTPDAPTA